MKLLVTGGAGFIGSAFIRFVLQHGQVTEVLNVDKLTYAGNLDNLAPVVHDGRYRFLKADIADAAVVQRIFEEFWPEVIVHFAAESHVDRSIFAPKPVIDTNILGTWNLLEACRAYPVQKFIVVSTDEVYGSVPEPEFADESWPLKPSSPYSASKASADLLALAYATTYGVPVVISRSSNNYGPYQFPEKLIPLMILNALDDQPLPVYGDGMHVRQWLHVEDHCRALWMIIEKGRAGEIYNIGGDTLLPNLEVVRQILKLTGKPESLIQFVTDRPGHDRRYAIDSSKIRNELGWQPQVTFEQGLKETVEWYQANSQWVERVRSGAYREYYEQNYLRRDEELGRLLRR